MFYAVQFESEFPQMLPIKESLIKYVFEPNAAKVSITSSCLGLPLGWPAQLQPAPV
jgi:hypothetical protein